MHELEKIAYKIGREDDVLGALMLANANGLSLHDTFTVHALILANTVLRVPAGDVPAGGARAYLADLIRPVLP